MARNDTQTSVALAVGAASTAMRKGGDPRVLAQALGQSDPRRGLRGGATVLQAARSAYLRAEWTGAHDRRLRPGALTASAV